VRQRHYWRSLEELTGSQEWLTELRREFSEDAAEWPQGLDRRRFLQLMGASFALAGLGACTRQPVESIIPYTKSPEEIIPGKPLYFASALTLGGYATGVLVESHMGRPTKLEGNPEHPASLGATDRFAQAAMLDLYDPDRSRTVLHLGRIRSWEAFLRQLEPALQAQEGLQGAGLRILAAGIATRPCRAMASAAPASPPSVATWRCATTSPRPTWW
jgi:molybdopterin-containing oxidoreductase family iron-sulfur binding subunit